jgi:hypothetical protein
MSVSIRWPSLSAVVSLCAVTAGLWLSTSTALAATSPVIEETAVLNVAGTSATFQAKIDPEGNETTYRFEYGTSEAYGFQVPIPDGLVGSGTTGVTISAHPQNLSPNTLYHYRVLALVSSRSETVSGSDGTFTTQPAGSGSALPDGRQWELVSPPNKHGALIIPLPGTLQASASGDGIAFGANVPTEQGAPGYTDIEQVLSKRDANGWSARDISPPHKSMAGTQSTAHSEYLFFSSDLSSSLVFPQGEDIELGEDSTLLSGRASEPTPYVRHESSCDLPASSSECYMPVVTGKEGFADVPPGTRFGGFREIEIDGASPDMHHVVMRSSVALTATPLPMNEESQEQRLAQEEYEWSADTPTGEALQLVSVLPENEGGGPARVENIVGEVTQNLLGASKHAISDDGSRIVWKTTGSIKSAIYLRDTTKEETVRLDERQPGLPSGSGSHPEFKIASSDGSRVFFTGFDQSERLTAESGTQEQDLYECEIVEEAARLKCDLSDLSPESGGHSAEVQGVLGASEDGSYVYFVANGVLGNGAEHGATQGSCDGGNNPVGATCNLYEYHDGTVTFIATLSGEDEQAWHGTDRVTARVSPDGHYVAFMSDRSLTGYENRDVNSGKPDIEVYMYEASSERLACASCNPTGARPTGVEAGEFQSTNHSNLVDIQGGAGAAFGGADYGSENWVAANLPAGVSLGSNESLYQPRALSDNGRLFFNSSDALVPQDVNGQEDVYEFESQGVGDCSVSSVTFKPSSDGCIGLISSGESPEETGFMDASEGGGDVFFLTTSRLTSQDYDTSIDVYDAHQCSPSAPCIAQPVSIPPCSSGDSCKAPPSLQPSIFGAPASATFSGTNNPITSSSKSRVKSKSLTRAQKRARALKTCRRKPKRKRLECEKQARRRYGAGKAPKPVRTNEKGQG